MREAVIAGYVRSPFTPAQKGALAKVRPDELMAQVVRGLLERTGTDPAGLEDMIIGCAFPEASRGSMLRALSVFSPPYQPPWQARR